MKKNLLTVGMAVHNDFKMLWATVQALKMEILKYNLPVEIIVVDNDSSSKQGKMTERFIQGHSGKVKAQYFSCSQELFGTTQPRQMVFDKSETPWTMCIDSHIFIWPGALKELVDWLSGPMGEMHQDNLLSGPLLMDDLILEATHFDLIWDAEMWGKWGTAWWDHEASEYFSVTQSPDPTNARPRFVKLSPKIVDHDIPHKMLYSGHQRSLRELGYQSAVERGYPFEIPAMGLGLFLAKTESWLGFNRYMRGFGGEEGYIHTKYRNAGRSCICLPFLMWNHKFNTAEEINYSVDRRNKVRNYVLAFNEVGLSLQPVFEHFVVRNLITQRDWDRIVSDPEGYQAIKTISPKDMLEKHASEEQVKSEIPDFKTCSVQDLFVYLQKTPRDLDQHLNVLKMVAEKSNTVVEFTHRRESTVGFMTGGPNHLISYQSENDELIESLSEILTRTPFEKTVTWSRQRIQSHPQDYTGLPPEFDTLFIDTDGKSDTLQNYLLKYGNRVKRFIVIHDTHVYGEMDSSGSKGLNYTLKAFCEDNPQWTPVHYTSNQYGLTILGCQDDDKPTGKVIAWQLHKGPGTELKAMNAELGIKPAANCSCNRLAAEMDWMGVKGCRENRDRIIQGLKENSTKYKWTDLLVAGVRSTTCSFFRKVNLLDIYGSMVDEAIRRAEENEVSQ
jgi:hypothetical protein